jgi:hypothetical protein
MTATTTPPDLRDTALRGCVAFGAAAVLLTELLSLFHLLQRGPLLIAWALLVALGWRFLPPLSRPARPSLVEAVCAAGIAAIAGIVGFTALLSPPNSADAMAYHLPRVFYWAQAGSVAFFTTPYFNQVMLQPAAEYIMLHTWLLSGGDRFVNLVQILGFLGSVTGVSLIARSMGLGAKGQAFAALFCATLPNGILQASGAKNDYLLALWMVAAVYFALRRDAVFLALSVALALATKATAYLFLPPILLALFPLPWRTLALAPLAILLLNGPQYVRNYQLSGSPLGYDSAQGDGFFRWRNEQLGVGATVSNLLRHTSDQLGARSTRWNQSVFDTVVLTHRALGLDPDDPATTWPWTRFEPPRNANHEANANNRWHLLIAVVAALCAGGRWRWYSAGLLAAFLLFCFYLKWQPFLARLELPLFVLCAPLAATLFERMRYPVLQVALCLFLLNNARPYLFENWTRPLTGPNSLLRTPRDLAYFNDMGQWNNRDSYLQALDLAARSNCEHIAIDISRNQLEYPFLVLLRQKKPETVVFHAGPGNACAVLCLDCAGQADRLAVYSAIGAPVTVGKFLLFLEAQP